MWDIGTNQQLASHQPPEHQRESDIDHETMLGVTLWRVIWPFLSHSVTPTNRYVTYVTSGGSGSGRGAATGARAV